MFLVQVVFDCYLTEKISAESRFASDVRHGEDVEENSPTEKNADC